MCKQWVDLSLAYYRSLTYYKQVIQQGSAKGYTRVTKHTVKLAYLCFLRKTNANICLHTVRFDDSHNAMTMCT